MKTYEGCFDGKRWKFAIIASRFNDFITKRLVDGAVDALKRHGVDLKNIDIIWVPGAFEIPLCLKKVAEKKYDAVICTGTIIKGETNHNEYIASTCIKEISRIGIEYKMPISLGIITVDTLEQAIERSGLKENNKGWQSAMAVLEMLNLFAELKK